MPPLTTRSGVLNVIPDQDNSSLTIGAQNLVNGVKNSTLATIEASVENSSLNETISQNIVLDSQQLSVPLAINENPSSNLLTENQLSIAMEKINSVEEIQVIISKLQDRLNSFQKANEDSNARDENGIRKANNSIARDENGIRKVNNSIARDENGIGEANSNSVARDENEIGEANQSKKPLTSLSKRKRKVNNSIARDENGIGEANSNSVDIEDTNTKAASCPQSNGKQLFITNDNSDGKKKGGNKSQSEEKSNLKNNNNSSNSDAVKKNKDKAKSAKESAPTKPVYRLKKQDYNGLSDAEKELFKEHLNESNGSNSIENSEISVNDVSEVFSTESISEIPSSKVSYNSDLPESRSSKVSYTSDLHESRSRKVSNVEDLTSNSDLIFLTNNTRKYKGKIYTSSCIIVPATIPHPDINFNYTYSDKAINKMSKLWLGPARDKVDNFIPPTSKECENFLYEYLSVYNEIFSAVLSQTLKEHIMYSIANFKHLMREDIYNALQRAAIIKYNLSEVLQVKLIDLPFQIVLDYFFDTYSFKSTPASKQDIKKLIQDIPINLTRNDYLYNLIYYQQSIERIVTKNKAEDLYLISSEHNKSHRKQLIKWISEKLPSPIMEKVNARLDGELKELNFLVHSSAKYDLKKFMDQVTREVTSYFTHVNWNTDHITEVTNNKGTSDSTPNKSIIKSKSNGINKAGTNSNSRTPSPNKSNSKKKNKDRNDGKNTDFTTLPTIPIYRLRTQDYNSLTDAEKILFNNFRSNVMDQWRLEKEATNTGQPIPEAPSTTSWEQFEKSLKLKLQKMVKDANTEYNESKKLTDSDTFDSNKPKKKNKVVGTINYVLGKKSKIKSVEKDDEEYKIVVENKILPANFDTGCKPFDIITTSCLKKYLPQVKPKNLQESIELILFSGSIFYSYTFIKINVTVYALTGHNITFTMTPLVINSDHEILLIGYSTLKNNGLINFGESIKKLSSSYSEKNKVLPGFEKDKKTIVNSKLENDSINLNIIDFKTMLLNGYSILTNNGLINLGEYIKKLSSSYSEKNKVLPGFEKDKKTIVNSTLEDDNINLNVIDFTKIFLIGYSTLKNNGLINIGESIKKIILSSSYSEKNKVLPEFEKGKKALVNSKLEEDNINLNVIDFTTIFLIGYSTLKNNGLITFKES
jgi:hypothetical protein